MGALGPPTPGQHCVLEGPRGLFGSQGWKPPKVGRSHGVKVPSKSEFRRCRPRYGRFLVATVAPGAGGGRYGVLAAQIANLGGLTLVLP